MTVERTAEEWGRVAVSLPGWQWMPGMLAQGPLVSWRQLQAIEVGEGPCRVEQLAALATAYRLTDAQVAGLVRAAGVSDG